MDDLTPAARAYAALAAARHTTCDRIAESTGLGAAQTATLFAELCDLGFVQPSRDLTGHLRAVDLTYALGNLSLDVLEGRRSPDALDILGGFSTASRLIAYQKTWLHATLLPSSLDSFSSLSEQVVTRASTDATTLHTQPLTDDTTAQFLKGAVRYLHRKGVPLRVLFDESFAGYPPDGLFQREIAAINIPTFFAQGIPGRGIVIDDGLVGVYHSDTAGLQVGTGKPALSGLRSTWQKQNSPEQLSRIRALDVLRHLCGGGTTQSIARKLDVSPRTVERDIALLERLFQAGSRSSLAAAAASISLA